MKPTTKRRIAGLAVLSLIPLTLVALAALTGQLTEMAIGAVIAAFICLTAYVGVALLDSGERQ